MHERLNERSYGFEGGYGRVLKGVTSSSNSCRAPKRVPTWFAGAVRGPKGLFYIIARG